MLTLCFSNNKGGVGKTTEALGFISAATHEDETVLAVDLDPQRNLTDVLGVDEEYEGPHIGDVLQGRATATQAVIASRWHRVDVIPGDWFLSDFERSQGIALEQRLKKALVGLEKTYDLVVIDCPPSLGPLTANALVAADQVVIATEPSRPATTGVQRVMEAVETVRTSYNPTLRIAGILVNKMPARGREATYRLRELREGLGDLVYSETIPLRAHVAESFGDGRPLHSSADSSAAIFSIIYDRIKTNDR